MTSWNNDNDDKAGIGVINKIICIILGYSCSILGLYLELYTHDKQLNKETLWPLSLLQILYGIINWTTFDALKIILDDIDK